MPRRRLISRTELARRAGVSQPAVTKLCNRGKLAPACVRDKVDLDHPAAVEYLASHGVEVPPRAKPRAKKVSAKPAKSKPRGRKRVGQPKAAGGTSRQDTDPDLASAVEAIESLDLGLSAKDAEFFASMTLERIAREYGTMGQFESVVKAVSTIAQIRERDDKHRREEGSVITRELVQTHVMGALEKLSRHLAKPVPDTVAARVIDMHDGGKPIEEIRRVAREIMGAELRATWSAVAKVLREA